MASRDGSLCSKQPHIFLKIFPLRACSSLNVVIIPNVCLSLCSCPQVPAADRRHQLSTETARNLEAALHSCVYTASSPVDSLPAVWTLSEKIITGTQRGELH